MILNAAILSSPRVSGHDDRMIGAMRAKVCSPTDESETPMHAIRLSAPGGPEALEFVELPVPRPGPGEVLVRAYAIGVGKPDVLFRTGVYRWMPPLPAVPGAEMSGTVEALGDGVTGLRVGQKVLVYHLKGGCYADYIAAPADAVTPLPDGIDLDDAVSLPNYQVAWALLNEAARGVDRRAVYVNGAAGGVGSAVIQICRRDGVAIIAGASTARKCDFARSQGATDTVEYGREPVADRVLALTGGRGVDVVLDHIVGVDFTDNLRMLAPMGMIVSFNMLGGWPAKDLFREMRGELNRSPAVRCFTMHSYDRDPAGRARILARTLELFSTGAVRPPIHARLPLSDAAQGHEMLDRREVLGKLVLKP
jgi:NADPH2:quinone reductase